MGPNDETKALLDLNREVNPIVKETDFPEKTQRMEQLVAIYRKDNNFPTNVKKAPQQFVATTGLKTRSFEKLTDENQQRVLSRISDVDYKVSEDILTFGSAKESPLTKNSEAIISRYSAGDLGDIADPLTDLVATIKSNSPLDVVKEKTYSQKEVGFITAFREMLSLKKTKKALAKQLANHQSVMQNIQGIQVLLEKQKKSLGSDIKAYEQMTEDTIRQIFDFELDGISLQLIEEKAEEDLTAITSQGDLDLLEASQANSIKDAIERVSRRKNAIETLRIITIQSMPQLAVLIKGNEIILEKIDEVENLVIPMWKWQYAIAIGAVRQQEAISIQKAIRGVTASLLKGNAKLLHDNMIAAYEELHASIVATEDLLVIQGYLDDMVTKVAEISKSSKEKTIQNLQTYQEIESKNMALIKMPLENN